MFKVKEVLPLCIQQFHRKIWILVFCCLVKELVLILKIIKKELLYYKINFEFFQLLEVVRVIDILFASGTDLIEFKGNIQNLDVMEIKQYTTKLLQNRIKNKIHTYEYKSIKEFQNHISEMSICLKSVKSDNVIISIIQKELDKFFIEGSNIFTLK